MNDLNEAQGLKVSVYTDQHGTAIRADILRHTQIEADGLEPHCRLSDATAVIDQLRKQLDEARKLLRESQDYLEGNDYMESSWATSKAIDAWLEANK